MSDSVIDLGELRHDSDPDPMPRPPRGHGRPLRCALVLLLALVTLAAAAVSPPRRTPVTLQAQRGSDIMVDGDLLLVMEPVNTSTRQGRLSAYRLPGGELVWQAPLSAEARYWGMKPLGGMLLATGFEIGPEGRDILTVALDRATGAYRWQQPGSVSRLADGNLLLRSGGETLPSNLRAVDPCCGTVRWQLPPTTAEVSVRDTGHGVDRLVLNQENGMVEVRDATTGAALAHADMRPPGGARLGIDLIDDLLLAIDRGSGTINAYGLDRLDRRWTRASGPIEFALDCGPIVCLRTGGNELQALDPATGDVRWRSDRWLWGWPYGGRLMANISGFGPMEQYVVIDALTGRQLADLGKWELYQLDVGGRLVGIRRHPDGGMLVSELDIAAGKVRIVDVLPDATGECQAITGYLVCSAAAAGSYQLWKLAD
ncbi:MULTISPECIES: PQQ-binding-like beta-propeller repeat protein [Micromonospora]|uniref:Outer membrane protein assembly factor BamB n=1 Tax=Micromonospora vinacea TaxID=709878 RepID=A0ABS0K386_9ACTN|nr:PQQ-binding-like beta-propeller repeat protein [Micromonospora vinacea]MBG6103020.1 outer membrane protein assembly factor BamB [Micromonospora vinacea]WSZ74231.1 PQQ-like beta-propeller repeat protein [Micromonospora sp. NBC_00860]WTA69291.1 PQQ-like beta-propeller repeat protein [Micromonospora sp. NBC_00855]